MFLAVVEHYHDYQPQKYFLDTEKLDPTNHVDALILKECKKKAQQISVNVDASNWEDNPVFTIEPGVTQKAKVKKIAQIDKTLELTIDFDC